MICALYESSHARLASSCDDKLGGVGEMAPSDKDPLPHPLVDSMHRQLTQAYRTGEPFVPEIPQYVSQSSGAPEEVAEHHIRRPEPMQPLQTPHSSSLAALAFNTAQPEQPKSGTYLKDADWQRIRPIFESLYIDEDLTLKEIMAELHLKHNFRATQQMFKKRIKLWGLYKNLRQEEVEHILGITAQRKGRGKETYFTLRGRTVDIRNVYRFQRRKKLKTSVAVANYAAGRSKKCPDLRPLTPHTLAESSWKVPNQMYEDTLRAFCMFFHGLVDSRYYWMEENEIVMPPSVLRGDVSDVCASLATFDANSLDLITIRKLSLLMESIIYSDDAWIHCRFIYMLWIISTTGHQAVATSLLTHLNNLVATMPTDPCAQYRFLKQYSSLEPSDATRLAGDMISMKADMVDALRVENPLAFKLRSLEYDVFWRQREQKTAMTVTRATSLLQRCHDILGPLAVETLTILKSILEDYDLATLESTILSTLLYYLSRTNELVFCEDTLAFSFNDYPLGMEAASELACIYCYTGCHDTEAWIFERLFMHQKHTASGLRREYSLLVHVSHCAEVQQHEYGRSWLQRKQDIEAMWRADVEAAVPTGVLLARY